MFEWLSRTLTAQKRKIEAYQRLILAKGDAANSIAAQENAADKQDDALWNATQKAQNDDAKKNVEPDTTMAAKEPAKNAANAEKDPSTITLQVSSPEDGHSEQLATYHNPSLGSRQNLALFILARCQQLEQLSEDLENHAEDEKKKWMETKFRMHLGSLRQRCRITRRRMSSLVTKHREGKLYFDQIAALQASSETKEKDIVKLSRAQMHFEQAMLTTPESLGIIAQDVINLNQPALDYYFHLKESLYTAGLAKSLKRALVYLEALVQPVLAVARVKQEDDGFVDVVTKNKVFAEETVLRYLPEGFVDKWHEEFADSTHRALEELGSSGYRIPGAKVPKEYHPLKSHIWEIAMPGNDLGSLIKPPSSSFSRP
ncbi:hypothetical protein CAUPRSCDRAFT_12250 [Caulochytrium protostelioides]|uniref:Uncharacterized protein n=1 Tax=Caulochytrium protostelioides TaxID=1555241 RepID=A0A4P9WS67_9FUNG|nr:hypothetical protein CAUPRSCDRAFT_12250 [Caulochytrium protostelioides]